MRIIGIQLQHRVTGDILWKGQVCETDGLCVKRRILALMGDVTSSTGVHRDDIIHTILWGEPRGNLLEGATAPSDSLRELALDF